MKKCDFCICSNVGLSGEVYTCGGPGSSDYDPQACREAAQIYAQVLRDGSYSHGRDININHNNYNNKDW